MKDPIDNNKHFLESQSTIDDLRLHTLLWFNAFEQTMKSILAWRLGCNDESLPNTSSSLLFRYALAGHDQLWNKKVKKFTEARNTIAHRFHEYGYENQLIRFCKEILDEDWPGDKKLQLEFLANAVRTLSLEISSAIDETPDRDEFPFPQLLYEMET